MKTKKSFSSCSVTMSLSEVTVTKSLPCLAFHRSIIFLNILPCPPSSLVMDLKFWWVYPDQ